MEKRLKNRKSTKDVYQRQVGSKLKRLSKIFAKASVGDFSANVPNTKVDDEFSELYIGVQIMLDVIRNKITDYEEKVQELVEGKAHNEALLSSIGDGIIATDKHGKIIFINKRAAKMLGVKEEEVHAKRVFNVIKMTDLEGRMVPLAHRPLNKTLRLKQMVDSAADYPKRVFFYHRLDGNRFPVWFTVTPVICAKRKFIGVVEVFRDISKEYESSSLKTEFVSMAAHQLGTPLSIISLYLDAIFDTEKNMSEYMVEHLREVDKATKRMIHLVNSLLNISRIEMGTMEDKPALLNVDVLTNSLLTEFRPQQVEKQIIIEKEIDMGDHPFHFDAIRLRMILQNLLSNAIKYNKVGGLVKLQIRCENGRSDDDVCSKQLCINVSDTGIGIPRSKQKFIFNKFYRGIEENSSSPEGAGLGLAIIKSSVDKSGGSVLFESEEGVGTTFRICLPCHPVTPHTPNTETKT